MILGRVVGTVVSTRKDEKLTGAKLLVVQPIDPRGQEEPGYVVAVDTVDAGDQDRVLVVSGSSARLASGLQDRPVDAAIIGVIDAVEVKGP
jgi:microcompartment protein CcmK/EutM